MNKNIIKVLLIVMASIMSVSDVLAQGIIVYKSDGTVDKISYAAIDSIVTYADYKDETSNEKEEDGKKPDNSTHESVDLGLSVKWATCNIGASSPEEYGDYFAWGETETKDDYSWESYKWCNGTQNTITKYCTDENVGNVDGRTILTLSDDVAHVKWGNNWRMPTQDEISELVNNCTLQETTQKGVKGYLIISNNGNSIFVPIAGIRVGTDIYTQYDHYWSSTLDINNNKGANRFYHYSPYWAYAKRCWGFPVRPVKE